MVRKRNHSLTLFILSVSLSPSISAFGTVSKTPSVTAFATALRKKPTATALFSTPDDDTPFDNVNDPNRWQSVNDPDGGEDWQEVLRKREDGWNEPASYESSLDDDDAANDIKGENDGPDDSDGADAWLDILQSISTDEISFMERENDRADKLRQMQEMGFSSDSIEATLGVAVDGSLEADGDDGMMDKFLEATATNEFGGVDEEVDLETLESHTAVEIDEETGEPVRTQHVYVDEHACIGCTNCAMIAQSTFFMHSEHGRARVFQQWGDDDETVQIAIETCPVDCIHYVPYEELVRLEEGRRGQNINAKARLVSQAEGGGSSNHRTGSAVAFTDAQQISGNMGSRCNNCPSAGCANCPMYGVGKNPDFERKENERKERRAKKILKQQMESNNKSVDL